MPERGDFSSSQPPIPNLQSPIPTPALTKRLGLWYNFAGSWADVRSGGDIANGKPESVGPIVDGERPLQSC